MSRNGSGTYAAPSSSWNPAVDATDIDSSDWAALLADLSSALTTSIASDGQTTCSASIPFAAGLSFPGGGKIDASGLLGIGMNPVNVVDITQTQNNTSIGKILNASAGAGANARWRASNLSSDIDLLMFGTGWTTSGVFRQDGGIVTTGGAGGLTFNTSAAQPIYFGINNAEVARFDASGNLLVGVTSALSGTAHSLFTSASGVFVECLSNQHASNAGGLLVRYANATPNDSVHEFLYCNDATAVRAKIRSDGGLANFSANNVNLASDARIKSEVVPHTKEELDALEGAFKAVDWGKFKYEAQTHDDWNYGLTTQGLATAFAEIVPAITEVVNPTKKVERDGVSEEIETPADEQRIGYYTEDLNNIAHALLARALQRIAALEAKLGI